jgi:hypothetical protein
MQIRSKVSYLLSASLIYRFKKSTIQYGVPITYRFDIGSVTLNCNRIRRNDIKVQMAPQSYSAPNPTPPPQLKWASVNMLIGIRKSKKKEDADSGSAIRTTVTASFQICGSGFMEFGSEYGYRY